ncbi:bifunctional cytidylyltransferase/SDR family oxidoreductase [Acrocarpospora corrugata]|uniref:bifunctional cytidylyltransferase/SDR family oxidoreductase n=1 Tax=Acrocarpospora corrugata TaxID=35763 RepID=UPI001FE92531|nr:bifunctional cytidylyltransferase/SDR family oxidoreductase [Acrocarpospora corrugata]
MPTVGVVLAGGIGQRIGLNTPKQLLKIAGKSILEHTIAAFDSHPDIDEVVVLMTPGFTDEVAALIEKNRFTKVSRILDGGASRTESTWIALRALGDRECDVLLHDAVRPLVEPRIIADCVTALGEYQAVDVAIPSSDTVVVAAPGPNGEIIRDIPDRARLRRGQTPQCFRLSVIRDAYARALADPDFDKQPATDDCGVMLRYRPDVPIFIVAGSEHNMKVTHPVDVFIADKLFQLAASTAPVPFSYGDGLDGRTLVVFGGSYGIGADIVDLAKEHGATVYSFSRSETGTRVQDEVAVAEALARVYAETGRIDYVVNTAAVLHMGKLGDAEQSTIEEAIGVNYLGPVNIAKASFKYLAKTRGHLLLYTSSSYTRGRADYSLYSSTKAAVVNLTQALADEWAEHGIRVNCLNPERTATPMRLRAFGEEPPRSLLAAKDVARSSVEVLISHLTGQVVDVRLNG